MSSRELFRTNNGHWSAFGSFEYLARAHVELRQCGGQMGEHCSIAFIIILQNKHCSSSSAEAANYYSLVSITRVFFSSFLAMFEQESWQLSLVETCHSD